MDNEKELGLTILFETFLLLPFPLPPPLTWFFPPPLPLKFCFTWEGTEEVEDREEKKSGKEKHKDKKEHKSGERESKDKEGDSD